jgi:hypothetical protein
MQLVNLPTLLLGRPAIGGHAHGPSLAHFSCLLAPAHTFFGFLV